jgi:hypothetical protein
MARFCKARLPEIKADLVRETSRIRSFDVEHTGYFVTPGNYHEISYRRNDILFRVHKTMTRTICGHRYLPGNPVVENYFGEYTESQRINVRDVGYDLAGQLYRPHITITRFEADVAAEPPVPSDDLSFTATMIGLFEADHLGAARRLIDRFDLT